MNNDQHITEITNLSWGRIEVTVNGKSLRFRDCKVWPGGAKDWDWNNTGTRHQPGIQPGDIEDILARDIEVVILSRGMNMRLQTLPKTEELLRSRGIEYHIEQTSQAIEMFNKLMKQGKKVGGIFHSTC
jgi:hypothetical protein